MAPVILQGFFRQIFSSFGHGTVLLGADLNCAITSVRDSLIADNIELNLVYYFRLTMSVWY